jgi:hypothetical protein
MKKLLKDIIKGKKWVKYLISTSKMLTLFIWLEIILSTWNLTVTLEKANKE